MRKKNQVILLLWVTLLSVDPAGGIHSPPQCKNKQRKQQLHTVCTEWCTVNSAHYSPSQMN